MNLKFGTLMLVKLISSYEINSDMYLFEEEEEYWNDIPKVKQELEDRLIITIQILYGKVQL